MKGVKISEEMHALLKQIANENGQKLEFVLNYFLTLGLGLDQRQAERKPILVQIVNAQEEKPQDVQANPTYKEVVKEREKIKKETAKKGLCLFRNSEYYDFDLFCAKTQSMDWFVRFAPLDCRKIYDAILNWSEAGNKTKVNWIATAFNFVNDNPNKYRPDGQKDKPKDVESWNLFHDDVINRI